MPSLYEIDTLITQCADPETGEISDPEKLDALMIERDKKIEGVALWYKNCLADAKAYKEEKDAFAEKQKRAEARAESLKNWLDNACAGEKFKTNKVEISYRKSTTTQIDCDVYDLPEEFLNYKLPEPKKTEIKKALQSGVEIKGCSLVENNNISIK